MELRQNKRYRLRAPVAFSWANTDGNTMRGEGYTRDISPAGVYVWTNDRLPSRTAVKLEVTLPSLNEKRNGASLRTQGHVVRSEEIGFAVAADIAFRMQFSEGSSSAESLEKRAGDKKFDASGKRSEDRKLVPVSRFWM
jgi:PilZ domain